MLKALDFLTTFQTIIKILYSCSDVLLPLVLLSENTLHYYNNKGTHKSMARDYEVIMYNAIHLHNGDQVTSTKNTGKHTMHFQLSLQGHPLLLSHLES